MRILVTGANGQLGYDVCRVLEQRKIDFLPATRQQFDLTDAKAVRHCLMEYHPDAVIHCAAYTAVDKAEDEREQCWAVNVEGTRNIALSCREIDAKMLYVSTDYVFSGKGEQPYEVDDPVGPLCVYGQTKLAGELAVKVLLDKYFIVRTSWVFGVHGNNFVKTMLRLGKEREQVDVVSDQAGSPTYTADLAPLLCDMVVSDKYGVYHAANEGFCSWANLALNIFQMSGTQVKVNEVSTEAYGARAARPHNSRLEKQCLRYAGFQTLPEWRDAVERLLQELAEDTWA